MKRKEPKPVRRARLLGWAVAVAGALDVASALTPDFRSRLQLMHEVIAPEVRFAAAAATALFGLVLLLLGRGIAHRRRLAYRAAVALLAVSTATHLLKGLDVEEATVTAVLGLLLVLNRKAFVVAPGLARWRTLARAVPVVLAIDFAYGFAGLYLRHSLVHPRLTPLAAAQEIAALMVGLTGPLTVGSGFGDWFPPSITALGFLSFAGFVALALAPIAERRFSHETERDEVREMIDRPDGDSLDPFALRRDKVYVFSPDRRAAVAYRYVAGVGLASGDPVGEPEAFDDALSSFLQVCEARGWRPAVLGARADRLDMYRRHGLKGLYMGDEAVVDTQSFTLEGRRMRNVRQSVAHTAKLGVQVEFHREGELDPTLRRALVGIAQQWRKGAPERGFSMALDALLSGQDPKCVVVVSRTRDGYPVAFQRYVPCKAGLALSLDAMRRDPDAPGGVNERMIVETVAWARDQGIREISLNFAAFRGLIEEGAELSLAESAQAWFVRRLDRFFQIESLRRFNSKFRPRWISRYIVYRSAGDLSAVGVAALSAEAFLPFGRSKEAAS